MSTRRAAAWFGILNLMLGLLSFAAPLVVGGSPRWLNLEAGRLFAVLTTNWAHAGLHVAIGIYGIASRHSTDRSTTFLWSSAVILGLLGVLGALGHGGLLEVRGADGELEVFGIAVDELGTVIHMLLAVAGGALAGIVEGEGELFRPDRRGAMDVAPRVLGMISGGVIAIILALVLIENTRVAPWAQHGAEGRLHFQMKNVTRLGGDAAAVRAAVERALAYGAPAPGGQGDSTAGGSVVDGEPLGWRKRVTATAGWASPPRHVVILPGGGERAALWSLPGAYWAAFSGAPVVFVDAAVAGADAVAALRGHELPAYLLAPPSLVSNEALARLEQRLGPEIPIERIAGDDLAAHAVLLASYRDADTDFGWGRDAENVATWFHFFMATPRDADAAYESLPLARTVAGPFLFADSAGGVPAATDRYWWSLRADWAVTPSETSFRHLWIVGDGVSYAAQSRMDVAVEKAPYISKGSIALSGLEGVGIVLIALGVAGFLFVLLHGRRMLPDVMPAMRIAWAFTALLVPVGGVLLYLAAYRRPRLDPEEGMPAWLRPPSVQAAAATAMGFGYGAPLMIVIGWMIAYYGFPLFFGDWTDGPQFLLGAGMPLMMAGMYLGAVLLAWPLVQTGMQAMMKEAPREAVAWRALGVTALSMAAVSLGMMATSWFMMMERHPMMMPHEDELLWIVSLWLASAIGFLVAWPLNWPMVRTRLKSGTM